MFGNNLVSSNQAESPARQSSQPHPVPPDLFPHSPWHHRDHHDHNDEDDDDQDDDDGDDDEDDGDDPIPPNTTFCSPCMAELQNSG